MTKPHRRWVPRTVVLLAGLVLLLTGCTTAAPQDAPRGEAPGGPPDIARLPWPANVVAADPVDCPATTVEVSTGAQLQTALRDAAPGTVIGLTDGTYDGTFTADASGTTSEPIWMCGGRDAVLRGPGPDGGTVLSLHQVRYWRLVGFSVREGQKGIMADGTSDTVVQDLAVTQIGDEAVHLRANSTDNVVRGLTISETGLRRVKFGEGIYVGSAVSNWCDITDCEPDRSDRNLVVANTISQTAAESVDIKEGTTGGVLADNTFDGAGMRGETDSWVDVKGNGWLIQANHGTTSKRSGFEVNLQADGWGTANAFDANTADVDGPGYGYELRPPTDDPAAHNRVTCTNTANGAAEGLTNTACA